MDVTPEERSERNSAVYLAIAALVTTVVAVFVYFFPPEIGASNRSLAAASAALAIGYFALYLWLQGIRGALECPAGDWLVSSVVTAIIGGFGLAAFGYSYQGRMFLLAAASPIVLIVMIYVAIKRYR